MQSFPFYLILIALYPALSLYASNITETTPAEMLRPLLISLLLVGFLFGVLKLILKNWQKSAILTSFFFLLFFSYGAVYRSTRGMDLGGIALGRHRVLIGVGVVLSVLVVLGIRRIGTDRLSDLTQIANIFALVLIALPIGNIVAKSDSIFWPKATANPQIPSSNEQAAAAYPDVYYIILDSYARSDYIQEYMQYDNSEFLQELRDRGFYIANCALSNYSFTRLSLGTSLNMNYIEALGDEYVPENKNEESLDHLILDSQVVRKFKDLGYTTVAFSSGYPFTELTDADYYFQSDSQVLTRPVVSEFEQMWLENSAFTLLQGQDALTKALGLDFPYYQRWRLQHYIIDTLQEVPNIPGPKFVFAHLVTTHRPFIFQSDGSIQNESRYYKNDGYPATEKDFVEGYQHGLEYTDSYLLEVVDAIRAKSARPAVIILQGDHGIQAPGRLTILNAISIPGGSDQLYESETPVNTFRIVFNAIAGTSYPLLPDRSQSSSVNKAPFLFTPADNSKSCEIQ